MTLNSAQPEFHPAPWDLTGRGYVFVYQFSKEFIRKQGMVPPHLQPHFQGGLGALMLVDYTSSNCGPYHELLFIPGKFHQQGRTLPSISRIYVSTLCSVINGRRNWGIPKDQADFQVAPQPDGSEIWRVCFHGTQIFQARLGAGVIPFPLHSALVPHTLMQSWEKQTFFTRLTARGLGRRARLLDVHGDGQHFPDLSTQKPILGLGVKLDSFHMTFHEATLVPDVDS